MAENLGASFTIDVSNLRAGLTTANRLIRESETQFKAAAAGMGNWKTSEEGLNTRISALNNIISVQKEKVKALKDAYNAAIAGGMDPMSNKAISMRTQINTATEALNKSEKESAECKQALAELGNEAEESGKKAKSGSEGYTVMKNIIANLATDAIRGAITAVKNMGSALVDLGKQSLSNFANFEQLEGGVKKLFGNDFEAVINNANNAFQTAGMSANDYMETVTGFSASLISGLNGDTQKAAEISDMAIRDMSDNANTFGTDINSLKDAYQGFAKGNFTMLDNLKLGYGGTQGEMARLINESGVLGDSMKVTAETVKDVPFDQMILAINKTQERMGIMGTTAREASTTIEGSLNATKGAWQNLVTGMAKGNANIEQLTSNFLNSFVTSAQNIVPKIAQIITGMSNTITTLLPQLVSQIIPLIQENLPPIIAAVQQAIQAIVAVLPTIIDGIMPIIPQIVTALITLLPLIIDAGIKILLSLIKGIADTIPQLVAMLPEIILAIVSTLLDNLPLIIKTGIDVLVGLIQGISNAIPQLVEMLPTIIETIISTLIANLPLIIETGIKLLVALITGIIQSLPQLIQMAPKIIAAVITGILSGIGQLLQMGGRFISELINGIGGNLGNLGNAAGTIISTIQNVLGQLPGKMLEIGGNIVKGIWDGITGFAGWLWDKISGFCSGIVDGIKGFFGISSPSKLMKNLIGKNMALGIGVGFEDEMPKVNKQIRNSIDDLTAGGFTADINGTSQMAEAGAMGGKSVVIYQTNNYKSSHSRYEIFKSKQQTEAAVKLALLGV